MACNDVFSDLSDWDDDILDEIDEAEDEILEGTFEIEPKVNFVSDEFIESVRSNVPDLIKNMTSSKAKAKQRASKKPNKNVKKPRPTKDSLPTFSFEKSWDSFESTQLFETALNTIMDDKSYIIGMFKQVRTTQLLAFGILIKENIQAVVDSLEKICFKLFEVIESSQNVFFSESKKLIWKKYYQLFQQPSFIEAWTNLFTRLIYVEQSDLLKHKISFSILKLIMSACFPKTQNENPPQSEVSDREQNIIRYVAGYIPFVLIKHYKKKKSSSRFVKVLESFSEINTDKQLFLDKTREWIDCTDRGGLFRVSDSAFLFFRSMEYVVRSVFCSDLLKRYVGENLRDVIQNQLLKSNHVINNWDVLTKVTELSEEEKRHLLVKIIVYFINVRGNAFIKAWVDQSKEKKETSLSKKGEHSLRKQINK